MGGDDFVAEEVAAWGEVRGEGEFVGFAEDYIGGLKTSWSGDEWRGRGRGEGRRRDERERVTK